MHTLEERFVECYFRTLLVEDSFRKHFEPHQIACDEDPIGIIKDAECSLRKFIGAASGSNQDS